ncbi:MAG: hypothetical protein WBS18_14755 [Candidatus Acidiferrales bacterium]
MKTVSKTKKGKRISKTAAKAYVDSQLRILRKYGTVELSDSKYKSMIRSVERATEIA